ncbi:MAG: large subunit ribosomal protein L21, partial [Pelagibacterales bacterium]|nr:large subunit ribosomal protein L21 [Pelagibacterales bacterium]
MSFAIIETGGKQYKVSASKILEIEKLEAEIGKTIQFKNVLLLNDDKNTEVGNPNVAGAIVEAKLLNNVKDRTILIFHKRRRKNSRKKNGHRQRHSKIQITKILSKDGKVIAEAKISDTNLKTKEKIEVTSPTKINKTKLKTKEKIEVTSPTKINKTKLKTKEKIEVKSSS